MYFVGINVGAQVAIILLACGPCVVIVNCWIRFCILGRAPRTKETLPDFHEWCRVTRHPQVFCGLTGCQWTPPVLGRHIDDLKSYNDAKNSGRHILTHNIDH